VNYLCDCCQGTGYVYDRDGHLDICSKCYGLGYVIVEQEKKPESPTDDRKIRRNGLYILLIIFASSWALILFFSNYVTYNIYEYFLWIFGPYYLGLMGNLLYVRHKRRRKEKDASGTDGH
jgi:hypothetical protein